MKQENVNRPGRLFIVLIMTGLASFVLSAPAPVAPAKAVRPQTGQVPTISSGKIPEPPDKTKRAFMFKEELTIGVREGDENYMFGERVYFNVDDEGNIFVTDWDRKRIQKYGPDGKYLLTIGREGQGPGEFHSVLEPEFDRDGNLYAVDIAQKRISFFSRDGRYVKQIGFPTIDVSSNVYINSHGQYLVWVSEIKKDDEAGSRWDIVVGLYDKEFRVITEFYRGLLESKSPKGRGEDALALFWADIMSTAFKPTPRYVLAPNDEIYFGFPDKYEVKVYSPDGKLTRIVRREYDPVPVTDRDKEQFEKLQRAEFLRFLPAQFENAKKKALRLIRYPEFKPAYQDFTIADNGWLFVIVYSQGNEATVLDVFDAEGRYIAQTEAPIPSEGLRFKNGKAYAVATEDSYKSVKRFGYTVREN